MSFNSAGESSRLSFSPRSIIPSAVSRKVCRFPRSALSFLFMEISSWIAAYFASPRTPAGTAPPGERPPLRPIRNPPGFQSSDSANYAAPVPRHLARRAETPLKTEDTLALTDAFGVDSEQTFNALKERRRGAVAFRRCLCAQPGGELEQLGAPDCVQLIEAHNHLAALGSRGPRFGCQHREPRNGPNEFVRLRPGRVPIGNDARQGELGK